MGKKIGMDKNDNQATNSSKTKLSIGSTAPSSTNKPPALQKPKNQYVITSPKTFSSDNIAVQLKKHLDDKKRKN